MLYKYFCLNVKNKFSKITIKHSMLNKITIYKYGYSSFNNISNIGLTSCFISSLMSSRFIIFRCNLLGNDSYLRKWLFQMI